MENAKGGCFGHDHNFGRVGLCVGVCMCECINVCIHACGMPYLRFSSSHFLSFCSYFRIKQDFMIILSFLVVV